MTRPPRRWIAPGRRIAARVAAQLGVFGLDVFHDLATRGVAFAPALILDVGAHVGGTTAALARRHPRSRIHAFEPSRQSFARLQRRVGGLAQVTAHQVALGDRSGLVRFQDNPRNRTLSRVAADAGVGYEVEMTTLDAAAAQHALDRIDYLKIDTEGHDLAVLRGAEALIARGAIGLVEVECGMNPDNTYHVPFAKVAPWLEARGFRLFGLYEQTHEWPTRAPHLRRANAVFLHRPAP